MRRLLVAVDLSERSATALAVANRVGGKEATYRVVHAATRSKIAAALGAAFPADADDALAALRYEAARIDGAEHKLLDGSPAEAIIEEAHGWRADTIVLAPRDRSGVRRFLASSASRHILRDSPASVLLARGDARRLDRVLLCTDLHAPSAHAATAAAKLVRRGARVTLLFAAHPAFWGPSSKAPWPPDSLDMDAEWLDRAQQEAVYAWLRTKVHEFNVKHLEGAAEEVVVEGVPQDVILQHARAGGHDLVILGTHGPTPYERVAVGSVAEAVAAHCGASVFVAKREQRL